MAGIDKLGLFPNSKMGGAAKVGQSRFRSIDSGTGSATIVGVDIPNQFPSSAMGGAVKLGTSQFISGDVAGAGSGGAPSGAIWSATDISGVFISSADKLTVTANPNAGAARGTTSHSTGKYYWEFTLTTNGSTWDFGVGIATSAAPLTYASGGGNTGPSFTTDRANGYFWNSASGTPMIGAIATGTIVGIAADFTNNLMWFRNGPTGQWNGSGTANPASGVGGKAITSATWFPFAGFSGVATGQNVTANFGATAFNGGVPSGFTSGW